MPNRRSQYAGRVGEWIAARRAERGWTQTQLAEHVGAAADRTVSNVETGATAVHPRMRYAWERALGWPAGSLTAAYRHGAQPIANDAVARDSLVILQRAGISLDLAGHPDVRAVLESSALDDDDRVELLRVWNSQRSAFESALHLAERRSREGDTTTA